MVSSHLAKPMGIVIDRRGIVLLIQGGLVDGGWSDTVFVFAIREPG